MKMLLHPLVLSVTVLASGVAQAEPDAALPEPALQTWHDRVRVRVDLEGGAAIAEDLQADIVAILREVEVPEGSDPNAAMDILIERDAEEVGAYRIVFTHDGTALMEESCPCSGDELRMVLRRKSVLAWKVLHAPSVSAEPEPVSPPRSDEAAPPTAPPRHGTGLWIAGLTTTAVGASVTLGAAAVLIADQTTDYPTQPATYGLLGAGVLLSAAGIPMWIIGHRRRMSVTASVGPIHRGRGLAFSLRGRF